MAIKEINTFIKSNKEDAMWLAQQLEEDFGEVEVHTLYVMDGFAKAEEPSGYLVMPSNKGEKQ